MRFKTLLGVTVASAALLPINAALAKVSAEQAAQLGGDKYTCVGALKAGTDSGVAAWTGKFQGKWPGMKQEQGYNPGPYADEKPLFTITAQNMSKYAANLTPGQQAMLKKYPDKFRMNIYPSHRDFAPPSWVCDVVKKNATTSEVIHDGLGVTGISGGIPFPYPEGGLQAVWNVITTFRAWTEKSVVDIADVYKNGTVAWGRQEFMTLNPGNNPDKRGSFQDKVSAYFYTSYILPERDKGFTAVGYQPNDFSNDATQSWQYLPGLRRVRQAPEVGFDYPVPPAGFRTVDDDYGFNGSPERYTWKLVGKKEFYIPANVFGINDPSIKYSDLITPSVINPKYERYELHRVWVIEGDLKPDVRHIYKKRRLYVDEDWWLVAWADNYDQRGQLYRTTAINFFYSPVSSSMHRGVSVYTDLSAGTYEAGYLVNERGEEGWWKINIPLEPAQFSPQAAARSGH